MIEYKKICELCNKEYITNYKTQKFCSKKCMYKNNSKLFKNRICYWKKEISLAKKGIPNFKTRGNNNPMKKLENRQKLSNMKKGKSWEEWYGVEMSIKLKIKKIKKLKGKSMIERFGEEKAIKIIQKRVLKMTGDKSHFWKGGISFEKYPYEFKQIKKLIRKRDNYTCQICRLEQNKFKRKLDVHHIDGNKKNNTFENLISLCLPCHMKLEHNHGKLMDRTIPTSTI